MLLTTNFTIATMLALSPSLTFAIVALIPLFLFARHHFAIRLSADSDAVQQELIGWNAFFEEQITSVLSVQLPGRERSIRSEQPSACLRALPVPSSQ